MDEGRGAAGAEAGAGASRIREIDPGVIDAPAVDVRQVKCEVCRLVFYESLEAHLERCHLNVFLSIDVDPAAGTATIRPGSTPIGFFNKFGG